MSRSRKKANVSGITTCESEKQDKRLANRKLRAAVRVAMADEAEVMPELREVSSVWTFGKDGKRWWGDRFPEASRK
jgi:tellurite resistance protein